MMFDECCPTDLDVDVSDPKLHGQLFDDVNDHDRDDTTIDPAGEEEKQEERPTMPPLSSDVVDGNGAIDSTASLLALSAKLRSHVIEMKRRRKVTFAATNDDGSTTTNKIIWIDPIPMDCRSDYFMSREEYEQIKSNCSNLVSDRKHQNAVDHKDDEIPTPDTATTVRGLESNFLSGEEFLRNYLHRRGAIRAVLKEQTFQKQTGYVDVDDIADAYSEYSVKSIFQARKRGQDDERECVQDG
jgi:hypothetical protein